MNTKLIQKLNKVEMEIESCLDAIDCSHSNAEETKLMKLLAKLQREKYKINKKIVRHEEAAE